MNTRIEDALSAATDAWRFVQRTFPLTTRTSPLAYVAIAGAGVVVGIGAGLLFAPQTGAELRASLVERSRGLADSLGAKVEKLANSAEEAVSSNDHRDGSSVARRQTPKQHARS